MGHYLLGVESVFLFRRGLGLRGLVMRFRTGLSHGEFLLSLFFLQPLTLEQAADFEIRF